MRDLLSAVRGDITPEEYLYRRVQKQSVREWLDAYELTRKNPPELQLNVAGFKMNRSNYRHGR